MRRVRTLVLRTRLYPVGWELPGEPRRQRDTEPSPDLAFKTIWHEPTLDVAQPDSIRRCICIK